MGAVVPRLVALALCGLCACSSSDGSGLGALPGDAGRSDAGAPNAPTDARVTHVASVGGACTADDECRGPATPRCLFSIDPGATVEGALLSWMDLVGNGDDGGVSIPSVGDLEVETPGGYCSGPCVDDDDCGAGAICFGFAPVLQLLGALPDGGMLGGFFSDSGQCLQPCDRDSDCRTVDGHVCRDALEGAPPLVPGLPEPPLGSVPRYCLPPLPANRG